MKHDVTICNGFPHPDIVIYLPKEQEITPMRMLATYKTEIRLGAGVYSGMMMSRLGLRCCYIDKVGSGIFGLFTINEMKRFGLDTKHIKFYSGDNLFCVVITRKGGDDTMVCYFPQEILSTSFNEVLSMIKNAPDSKVLYLFSWFWSFTFPKLKRKPTHKILHYAKKRGFSIVLDVNYKLKEKPPKHDVEELKKALKDVDVLIPNLRDAETIVGQKPPAKVALSLLKLGPKIVGLKMGDKGSYVASKQESGQIPPFKVEIFDTTGAGDVFGGAFTYGWLKEWKPKKIATFANAASAFCISHEKKNKYPTLRQIQELLGKKNVYK